MNNTQSIQSNLLQQRINEAIVKKVASTLTGSDFFERQKEGFMGNAAESYGDLPAGNRVTAVMGVKAGFVGR